MPPETRPDYFSRWSEYLSTCDSALGNDPLAGCLGFAAAQSGIARLVVGVESEGQLREIVEAAERARDTEKASYVGCEDPELIEPRLWEVA